MRTRGFTLVELMVAVVIVAIMLGVGVPALTQMLSSGGEDAAESMIRAMLARAQAHAAVNQKYAGIRFQFDRDGWQNGTQYMVLIENDGGATFRAVADETPATLPKGIGVFSIDADTDIELSNAHIGVPNGTGNFFSISQATTFSIIFSPSGQLITKSVAVWPRASVEISSGLWNFDRTFNHHNRVERLSSDPLRSLLYCDGGVTDNALGGFFDFKPWCLQELSTRGLVIFDVGDMLATNATVRYSTYANRLEAMLINAYTGELIED